MSVAGEGNSTEFYQDLRMTHVINLLSRGLEGRANRFLDKIKTERILTGEAAGYYVTDSTEDDALRYFPDLRLGHADSLEDRGFIERADRLVAKINTKRILGGMAASYRSTDFGADTPTPIADVIPFPHGPLNAPDIGQLTLIDDYNYFRR